MPSIRTVLPTRPLRVTRAAAVATACVTVGAITVVIADDQSAPQFRSIAEQSQPVAIRYFDTEANKVASMRALRRHIAEQRAIRIRSDERLKTKNARGERAPK